VRDNKAMYHALMFSLLLAAAASAATIEGDWQGTLKSGPFELRLVLHITKSEKGAFSATMDSIDQNGFGLPVDTFTLTGSALAFEMQAVKGSYEGKVNPQVTAISGTWTQNGRSAPLEFTRARPKPPSVPVKPSDIDGDWQGTLETGAQPLRVVLHILNTSDGLTGKIDSLDQNAMGLPVTTMSREGKAFKFEMRQMAASFRGTIRADLSAIDGTFTQAGKDMPLLLKRLPAAHR